MISTFVEAVVQKAADGMHMSLHQTMCVNTKSP